MRVSPVVEKLVVWLLVLLVLIILNAIVVPYGIVSIAMANFFMGILIVAVYLILYKQ